jgi:hypothetical protein
VHDPQETSVKTLKTIFKISNQIIHKLITLQTTLNMSYGGNEGGRGDQGDREYFYDQNRRNDKRDRDDDYERPPG